MSDPALDLVAGVFRSSQLYGVWQTLINGVVAASRESTLLVPIRSFASAFAQQSASRKLASAAMTIGVAALALVAIRAALPQYATSGLPWWWNIAAAVFAFWTAIAADTIASAWVDSTPARIWRHLPA